MIFPVIIFPESGAALVNAAFAFATGQFGWLYLLAGLGVVIFLVGLAISRCGNVRLEGPDDKPELSYFSWVAMILAGGIGIAIVNWAWWIAYAPMMGLFVARISRGRTIRELIIAELVFGSLGTWMFFVVWGGYALDLQISGTLDVAAILSEGGIPSAVQAILNTLPMSDVVTAVFIVLCFVFLATTLDSSAYVLASVTSRKLSGYQEPKQLLRLTWAFLIAGVGVALIQMGGAR